jgi:hypothetical protein
VIEISKRRFISYWVQSISVCYRDSEIETVSNMFGLIIIELYDHFGITVTFYYNEILQTWHHNSAKRFRQQYLCILLLFCRRVLLFLIFFIGKMLCSMRECESREIKEGDFIKQRTIENNLNFQHCSLSSMLTISYAYVNRSSSTSPDVYKFY